MTDPTAPARPTWNVPAPARRQLDLKIVVAVLIGLVSVTGAVMTWRSAQLGENATDLDRLAVAQTAQAQRSAARTELIVQDARLAVAAAADALRSAAVLEERAAGGFEGSELLAEEAFDLELVGRGHLANVLGLQEHVTIDDQGNVTFDEVGFVADSNARDLTDSTGLNVPVDPIPTIRTANELRDESERFDLWRIPLAAAIVLLTVAQVLRPKLVRLGLTGLATATWITSTVLAFAGASVYG